MKYYFLIFSLFISSCNLDPVQRAINVIQGGINSLNTNSSQWQKVLRDISRDLPNDVHQLISNDLSIITNNAIGGTTASAMCTMTFMGDRVKQSLENVIKRLKNEKYTDSKPSFCTLTVGQLDMNNDLAIGSPLSIYGYDLNSKDTKGQLLKVALTGNGKIEFVSEEYIGHNTNWQVTININSLITTIIDNKYTKIKLYWNGSDDQMPEITIAPWVAKTKTDVFTPTPITFIPPHTGGNDADFDTSDGNWTSGEVFLELNVQKDFIDARLFMDVMEFGGDNTRAGRSVDPSTYQWTDATAYSPWRRIYTVADTNKYQIIDLSPKTISKFLIKVVNHDQLIGDMGGESISRYTIDIDRAGDEAGTFTKVNASFNQLTVVLISKKPR
ncbi:hypothetical protein [Pedobacter sp. CFBP9032]|uniref:hypothetical protein n=1 Tax=Pedobacter sp. CFBP9032 TaxID=3096539 RepID=UPI002A6A7307|nr:hypothetical protein [Pedobacter sp. CFBP9032]MDY0905630.1 hypothetical protein [Pedobacter sp. CFBP9032]